MKTCLVVEDSTVVRKISLKMFRELGFDVSEAVDGIDAQHKVQEAMPDVILLDWHMPKMDGIAFIKWLRQQENGDIPQVIFCTTETELANIQQAFHAGANEYVMKPFDKDILESKLSMLGLV